MTLAVFVLLAGCNSNPCPGQLTCASHKCCPIGYPYHCGDQCYTSVCTGAEVCVDQSSSNNMTSSDIVKGIVNAPTVAQSTTNWTATNACNNGVERYILGADGTARYNGGAKNGGATEDIMWSELNTTTIIFSGSAIAVQLRDIMGSYASGQFQAESLHTGGGNANCGYILTSGTF